MKKFAWFLATASLCLPLAVSAQDATPESEGVADIAPIVLPPVDPLMVSGDISIAGSSTVYPLAEAIAEQFVDEGYEGNITIDSIGSGAGLDRFCVSGETDIANASRAIEAEEVEQCASIGRTVIEFRVGTDALTVAMSAANDFVTDLTEPRLGQRHVRLFCRGDL
jgi:phosphate transport system substrate-binding protein